MTLTLSFEMVDFLTWPLTKTDDKEGKMCGFRGGQSALERHVRGQAASRVSH